MKISVEIVGLALLNIVTLVGCCPSMGWMCGVTACYNIYECYKPFQDAIDICNQDGFNLASVASMGERQFLHSFIDNLAPTDNLFWVGGTRETTTQEFTWLDGAPFLFQVEATASNDLCLIYKGRSDNAFVEETCNAWHQFICRNGSGVPPSLPPPASSSPLSPQTSVLETPSTTTAGSVGMTSREILSWSTTEYQVLTSTLGNTHVSSLASGTSLDMFGTLPIPLESSVFSSVSQPPSHSVSSESLATMMQTSLRSNKVTSSTTKMAVSNEDLFSSETAVHPMTSIFPDSTVPMTTAASVIVTDEVFLHTLIKSDAISPTIGGFDSATISPTIGGFDSATISPTIGGFDSATISPTIGGFDSDAISPTTGEFTSDALSTSASAVSSDIASQTNTAHRSVISRPSISLVNLDTVSQAQISFSPHTTLWINNAVSYDNISPTTSSGGQEYMSLITNILSTNTMNPSSNAFSSEPTDLPASPISLALPTTVNQCNNSLRSDASMTTNPTFVVNMTRICKCYFPRNGINITNSTSGGFSQSDLVVAKRKKLRTADDARPSARCIGWSAVALLVVGFVTIVVMDAKKLMKDTHQMFQNIKHVLPYGERDNGRTIV